MGLAGDGCLQGPSREPEELASFEPCDAELRKLKVYQSSVCGVPDTVDDTGKEYSVDCRGEMESWWSGIVVWIRGGHMVSFVPNIVGGKRLERMMEELFSAIFRNGMERWNRSHCGGLGCTQAGEEERANGDQEMRDISGDAVEEDFLFDRIQVQHERDM